MEAFLQRVHKFDPHRLTLAPFFGLLAGFLANRAHDGALGWALLGEMVLGAALVTFGAAVLVNLRRLIEERDLEQALIARRQQIEYDARKQTLIEGEAERYHLERFFREQVLAGAQRTEWLERQLDEQRLEANSLRKALGLMQGGNALGGSILTRLERLEQSTRVAEEAREKIVALEVAYDNMRAEHSDLSRQAVAEVEEVKASLLQLAITESQRNRNLNAPENDQSGRIIELETRIHKLAREIEAISKRQAVVPATGIASDVAPGGTRDNARLGFLTAMLDANKTLRKRIKDAA
ncbi:MAG: hypothetical protein K8I27_16800 [Planctomycetes bacterium]|nr:hypothetical protein [Planctomycetota bacterium]